MIEINPQNSSTGAVVLAWSVWLFCTLATFLFVLSFYSEVPYGDEYGLVPVLTGSEKFSWGWLWSPHNEHRIVVSRLILVAIFALTKGIWLGMFLIVALLSAGAALSLASARLIRGRTAWFDSCIPLFWLNWGQVENLLWAFQLQMVIPVVLIAVIVWTRLHASPAISKLAPVLTSGCLLLMTLCGGNGILAAFPFLIYSLACLVFDLCRFGLVNRQWGWNMWLSSLLIAGAVIVTVAWLIGLQSSQPTGKSADLWLKLSTSLAFFSTAWGPAWSTMWVWGGMLFVALAAVSSWYALFVLKGPPRSNTLTPLVLCVFAGCLLQALAVGFARSNFGVDGGLQSRYQTILLPGIMASLLLVATIRDSQIVRVIQMLFVWVPLLTLCNVPWGLQYANDFDNRRTSFMRDLSLGVPQAVLAQRYHCHPFGMYSPSAADLNEMFSMLQAAKSPPFDRMKPSPKLKFLTMPCIEVATSPDGKYVLPPNSELNLVTYEFAYHGPPQIVEIQLSGSKREGAATSPRHVLAADKFQVTDGSLIRHTASVMEAVLDVEIHLNENGQGNFVLTKLSFAIADTGASEQDRSIDAGR